MQTLYCYRVRAYSDQVTAPAAVYSVDDGINNCRTTPLPAPVLNPPTGITASQVTLSWGNVTGNTGYEIQMDLSAHYNNPEDAWNGAYYFSNWQAVATVGANVTSYTVTGIGSGLTYRYRVRDLFAGGYSAYSNWVYATNIPGSPDMKTPTAVSPSQLNVDWYDLDGETSYQLQWKAGAGGTWSSPITIGENITTYIHSGLTAGTVYYYRLKAINGSGESAYSSEVSKSTLLDAPVLNPVTGVSASSVTLSWNNISGNTGYLIERKTGTSGSWSQLIIVAANVTSYTNSGLTAGTVYTYRVSAVNGGGNSAPSNEQGTVSTPAATVVTGYVAASDRIELSWPVVLGASDYKLAQKQGVGGSYSQLWSTTVGYSASYCGSAYPSVSCPTLSGDLVRYSVSGLLPDSTYCYQVTGHNGSGGDSAASNEICFKTMAVSAPTLTVTPVTPSKVRLDWVAGGGSVTPDGYLVEMKLPTGGYTRVATVPGSGNSSYSYIDTKRQPNTAYTYRVRPYRRVGDDYNGGYNGALWTPRGIIRDTANVVVSSVSTPPVDIVDVVNGTARVNWLGGEVELRTSSTGGGQAGGYNVSRLFITNPGVVAGELDMDVDYRLPEGAGSPTQYHVYSRLILNIGALSGGTDTIYVERSSIGIYVSCMIIGGAQACVTVPTQDASGRLQISKKADRITASVMSGNSWVTLQERPYSESGNASHLGVGQFVQRNEVMTLHAFVDNFEVLNYLSPYSNEAVVTTPSYTPGADVCQ
jgi:fibronectin type III domain protein